MAIILAVDKWHPYLQNAEFVIRSYHILLHLTEQCVSSRIQQKALLKLMDLQLEDVVGETVGSHHVGVVTYHLEDGVYRGDS